MTQDRAVANEFLHLDEGGALAQEPEIAKNLRACAEIDGVSVKLRSIHSIERADG